MINERDELIWMAGFFDGEGCVSVGRQMQKFPRKLFQTYAMHTILANRVEDPLRRFHRRFGGSMWKYAAHGQEYWRWATSSHKSMGMLRELLPYLLVKRPIAECAIRFQEHMTQRNKEFGRTGYPDYVRVELDSFYQQARALNAKQRANYKKPKHEMLLRADSTVVTH